MNLHNKINLLACGFISLILVAGCGLKGELYQTPESVEGKGVVPEEKTVEQAAISTNNVSTSQLALESTENDNNINNPSSIQEMN